MKKRMKMTMMMMEPISNMNLPHGFFRSIDSMSNQVWSGFEMLLLPPPSSATTKLPSKLRQNLLLSNLALSLRPHLVIISASNMYALSRCIGSPEIDTLCSKNSSELLQSRYRLLLLLRHRQRAALSSLILRL
ncbi:hypothetical protein K7X08_000648 [Anisodus acutangulus]|uniref:Uncharacterized protein n=1 Tax=Anisodus acutangulus TaxID=402998 RepID=A0A9Q1M7C8_9SOLA|nr:hypothetical protein K7X08_000648 [Anisodus acutangulus]